MGLISNGTTIFDDGVMASGLLSTSNMIKIKDITASASSTLDFTSGIDSTYKEYLFTFSSMHPSNDQQQFTFQVDTGTNTNYNQVITSNTFQAYHNESGAGPTLTYVTGYDQAQGTAAQMISEATGNAADECVSGYLHLFEPSSATFVKHFIGRTQAAEGTGYSGEHYTGGYINTTTAITRVQFAFVTGNIDAGQICLYGIL